MTLDEKIADLKARLSVLSEARAGGALARIAPDLPRDTRPERDRGFNRPTPQAHHESSIPAGVNLDDRGDDRPPPKDRSLYDWYCWHFDRHADEPGRLLSLYLLGERDYLERVDRSARMEKAARGSITAYSEDGAFVEGVHALRVIEWYEGVHPRDVATVEGVTEQWVRKIRSARNRRPDDGRRREAFMDMDETERRRTVTALAGSMGQKRAADKLGVAKSTVQKYWPDTP